MMNIVNFVASAVMFMAAGTANPNELTTGVQLISNKYEYVMDDIKEERLAKEAKKEIESEFKIEYYRYNRMDNEYTYLLFIDNQIIMGNAQLIAETISDRTMWNALIYEDEVVLLNREGDAITIELGDDGENEYSYDFKNCKEC